MYIFRPKSETFIIHITLASHTQLVISSIYNSIFTWSLTKTAVSHPIPIIFLGRMIYLFQLNTNTIFS